MNKYPRKLLFALLIIASPVAMTTTAEPNSKTEFDWTTVVNNNDLIPDAPFNRTFNSYNQPSVNKKGLVVMRARSIGGHGQPATHGIYIRDMSTVDSEIIKILDRTTLVPQPNNLSSIFVETPSFPRIDMNSSTIATRGNHKPVWRYIAGIDPDTGEPIETRGGTTGLYTNPFGPLLSAVTKLGGIGEYYFHEVPEYPSIGFEVFPGAPSVTEGNNIVFKGNYTAPDGSAKTGVYYRKVASALAGGSSPVILIANSSDTVIPGTDTVFGSTAPPSAANQRMVFSGFDNEEVPTLGGIYLAQLKSEPELETLISIGQQVPGESSIDVFNHLGEANAFDGRFVGFWGAWGDETKTVRLYCPTEGNKDRIAYCNRVLLCEGTEDIIGDQDSICNDDSDPNFGSSCYQDKQIPVNQGIFVHDTKTNKTHIMAKSVETFDDFLFWNYSGKPQCVGSSHSDEGAEDDGEAARWRSSAFVAVSGRGATFKAAFKARTGELSGGVYIDQVDGIYLGRWPSMGMPSIVTVLDTAMVDHKLDPEAPEGAMITELGLEREGLRGDWLVLSAKMGVEGTEEEEDEDLAGVYITKTKRP